MAALADEKMDDGSINSDSKCVCESTSGEDVISSIAETQRPASLFPDQTADISQSKLNDGCSVSVKAVEPTGSTTSEHAAPCPSGTDVETMEGCSDSMECRLERKKDAAEDIDEDEMDATVTMDVVSKAAQSDADDAEVTALSHDNQLTTGSKEIASVLVIYTFI